MFLRMKATKQKDWTSDSYFWVNKGSQYNVPKNAKIPDIYVWKYWISTEPKDRIGNEAFRRRIYRLNKEKIVIVQYIGDETVYKHRSHGNSDTDTGCYTRTLPSTIQQIKNPSDVYRK